MKVLLFLVICAYVGMAYVTPNIAYDKTEPTCANVQALIAKSTADLVRLSSFVDNLLPTRISRTGALKLTLQKVFFASKQANLLLVQKSSSEQVSVDNTHPEQICQTAFDALDAVSESVKSARGNGTPSKLQADKAQGQDSRLQEIMFSVQRTCEVLLDPMSGSYPSLLQKSSSSTNSKQGNSSKQSLEQTYSLAINALDALSNYMKFLIPTIRSTYIDGEITSRISTLSQFNAGCLASIQTTAKLPQVVRLADPNNWGFNLGKSENIIGNYYYKFSVTKDTLVECEANGHGAGGYFLVRFMLDNAEIGVKPTAKATTNDPKLFNYGAYHRNAQSLVSNWLPFGLTTSVVVPKGDHVIALKGWAGDNNSYLAGVEVIVKIYN